MNNICKLIRIAALFFVWCLLNFPCSYATSLDISIIPRINPSRKLAEFIFESNVNFDVLCRKVSITANYIDGNGAFIGLRPIIKRNVLIESRQAAFKVEEGFEIIETLEDLYDNPTIKDFHGELSEDCTQIFLGELISHQGRLIKVMFSPNGKYILTASRKSISIWDAKSGTFLYSIPYGDVPIMDINFSPTGEIVIVGDLDGRVIAWESETGAKKNILYDSVMVSSTSYSPNKRYLGVVNYKSSAMILDAQDGSLVRSLIHYDNPMLSLLFSPNNKYIATSGLGGFNVWQIGKALPLVSWDDFSVEKLSFSYDSKLLATVDAGVKIWNVPSGSLLRSLLAPDGNRYSSASFSPDGHFILAVIGRKIHVWDTEQWTIQQTLEGPEDNIIDASFSYDGLTIVATSKHGKTKVLHFKNYPSRSFRS